MGADIRMFDFSALADMIGLDASFLAPLGDLLLVSVMMREEWRCRHAH